MDKELSKNSSRGHVAFVTPKSNNNIAKGEHSGVLYPSKNLSNGTWRTLDVEWTVATKTLKFTLEGIGSSSKVINVDSQFGGNSVYWGFTGSTGGSYAENLIAITTLPNSLSSKATLQNLSLGSVASDNILADYNNQIKIENTIETYQNATDASGYNVDLVYPISNSLEYEPGSFQINDVSVPDNELTISNNEIHYKKKFENNSIYKVTFNTKVTSKTAQTLTTPFFVNELNGNQFGHSNNVTISISGVPKVQANIVANGVDEESKEADGSYKQVLKFGDVSQNVFEYGDPIDISQNTLVTSGKNTMTTNGWLFQGTIQQLIDGSPTSISDTSVKTSSNGTVVNYLYKAQKGTILVKFLNSKNETVAMFPDISIEARIPDGPVDLTKNQNVIETLQRIESNDNQYEIVSHDDNVTSVTPKADETVTVTYKIREVNYSLVGDDFTVKLSEIKGKSEAELSTLIRERSNPSAFTMIDNVRKDIPQSSIIVSDFGGLDKDDVVGEKTYTIGLAVPANASDVGRLFGITIKFTVETDTSVIVDPEDGKTPFSPTDPASGDPVDPNPATDLLKIQYVSDFNFGTVKRNLLSDETILSNADYGTPKDGAAKKVPAFVSISNQRPNSTGWRLSVSADNFVNTANDKKSVLEGAYLTLSNGIYNVDPDTEKPTVVNGDIKVEESPSPVSSSQVGLNGSWSLALGNLQDGKSSGVNLTVPKNAVRSLGDYAANVTWTLAPDLN